VGQGSAREKGRKGGREEGQNGVGESPRVEMEEGGDEYGEVLFKQVGIVVSFCGWAVERLGSKDRERPEGVSE
jgi:hypothetical protein